MNLFFLFNGLGKEEYFRQYREKHKEKLKQYQIEWRKRNKDKTSSYNKKYFKKNKAKLNSEYRKKYKDSKEFRDKDILKNHDRWAYKHSLLKLYNNTCQVKDCDNKQNLEIHHLDYEGGINKCQLLCREHHKLIHIK